MRNTYEIVPLRDGRLIIIDQHIRPVRIKGMGLPKTWFRRSVAERTLERLNHGDVPATITLP